MLLRVPVVLGLLLPAVVLAAPSAAPVDPSSPPLDAGLIFSQSLVLPAWGASRSGSYLAASLQLLVDAVAVAALVGLAVDPPNPDAGVHLAYVIPVGLLVANRIIGAPLNAALACGSRGDVSRHREMRLSPAAVHGRLSGGIGAYANSGEAALGVEWRRAGLKMVLGLTEARGQDYGWWESDLVRRSEHYSVEGFLGMDAYYRLRLNAFMDLEPGLRCHFQRYRYGATTHDIRADTWVQDPERRTGYSPSLIPHAALVLHPLRRLELAVGAGYALGKPTHLRGFASRARSRDALFKEISPWRMNAEMAVPIF